MGVTSPESRAGAPSQAGAAGLAAGRHHPHRLTVLCSRVYPTVNRDSRAPALEYYSASSKARCLLLRPTFWVTSVCVACLHAVLISGVIRWVSLDRPIETHFHFELAVLVRWVPVHPGPQRVLEVRRDESHILVGAGVQGAVGHVQVCAPTSASASSGQPCPHGLTSGSCDSELLPAPGRHAEGLSLYVGASSSWEPTQDSA